MLSAQWFGRTEAWKADLLVSLILACHPQQDLLDANRRRAATAGLLIRPRLFVAAQSPNSENAELSPLHGVPDSPPSPESTATQILYLRTTHGQQGVLSTSQGLLHPFHCGCSHMSSLQVIDENSAVQGFRMFLRTEEIWRIMHRGVAFHNWFTKLCPGHSNSLGVFLFCHGFCCGLSRFAISGATRFRPVS